MVSPPDLRDEMWRRRRERSTKTLAAACEDIYSSGVGAPGKKYPTGEYSAPKPPVVWSMQIGGGAASGAARHP